MRTCFVIQPFDDGGPFDKRFADVFKPAITDAGLEPYRVDEDPSVDVPIDTIEERIRNSTACLADITVDNPNVWYELGFAFAANRPVAIVCSEERGEKKYPFDIQHRTVVSYKVESSQDFDRLRQSITKRLKAILARADTMDQIRDSGSIAPIEGLSQFELAVLAASATGCMVPDDHASLYMVRQSVERAGFTEIAMGLGIRRLGRKGFIEVRKEYHQEAQENYDAVFVLDKGWDWIEKNEGKFNLRRRVDPTENEEKPY